MGTPLNIADKCLLGVAIASLAVMCVEMFRPYELEVPVEGETSDTAESVAPAPVRRALGTETDYSGIAERPLFTFDRRPYQAPVAEPMREEPPAPPPPRIDFELSAIVTTPIDRIALLRTSNAPEMIKLSVGETYEQWTLSEVTANAVVLQNGTQSITVPLREADAERVRSRASRRR